MGAKSLSVRSWCDMDFAASLFILLSPFPSFTATLQMWRLQLIVITSIFAEPYSIDLGAKVDVTHVTALVPTRAGSKGINNKNLSKIGNDTLIARALSTIFQSQVFHDVWVSTDGEEIGNEAQAKGANVHWRHPDTATDSAPTLLAVKEFLDHHPEVDKVAVIQCTSPFLCPQYLKEAVKLMAQGADCVFAVTKVHRLRWKPTTEGFVVPENFNISQRPRRQDWSGDMVETGMFYFTKRSLVYSGILQNNRCGVVEVPSERAMEIDTAVDLQVANILLTLLHKCE